MGEVTLKLEEAMAILNSDTADLPEKMQAAQTVAFFHAVNAECEIDGKTAAITQKLCRMTASAIDENQA